MPEVDEFKLTVLVHKCLHGTALPYLADELHQSSDFEGYFADTVLLCIVDISDCPPHISLDPRCMNFSGSRVWQALPQNLISDYHFLFSAQSPEDFLSLILLTYLLTTRHSMVAYH